jgi:hypothetical protein
VVNDDFVADGHVVYRVAQPVHDARHVTSADMEVIGLAHFLADANDVDGDAAGGPDVVVVDAGRHDGDQHLMWLELRHFDFFDLKGASRIAKAILAHDLGEHLLWNLADWR